MSAIVGAIGKNIEQITIKKMLEKIKHRGAEISFFTNKEISLGYSSPPYKKSFIKDGNKCIAIDGEIYNYQTLTQILPLYIGKRPSFVSDVDGEFVVVVVNGKDVFIARDILGVKPLYYGYKGDNFYFASEIKSLVGITDEVKEFPAGNYFRFDNDWKRFAKIKMEMNEPYLNEVDDIIHKIKELLDNAVKKRLKKNIKTGVFLSGGLDSSIIAYLVKRNTDNVVFFSAGMEGSNDLKFARQLADYLKVELHTCIYNREDMLKILPEVIYYVEHFDAPLIRSCVPNFLVAKLASKYVKEVFIGEGGDELFGGYHYLKELDINLLNTKLLEMLYTLHNTGLQRCDRIPMGNSVEAKIPFLDIEFVKFALKISPRLKIHGNKKIEKWILRKAFEDVLPKEIVWRTKQKFSEGAGSIEEIRKIAEEEISDKEFAESKNIDSHHQLRTKEELYYYRIFRKFYSQNVLPCLGFTEVF